VDMPQLLPGQACRIWTAELGKEPLKQFESFEYLLESPNWLSSGDTLVLNGDGRLWRLSLAGRPQLGQIVITDIPQLNNDHVLDPDGKHIYLSAYDGQMYRAEVLGGVAELVTKDAPDGLLHYLHGVDPSGDRLAFIGIQVGTGNWWERADVFTMSVNGGDYRQLTSGPGPSDGCEYTPDGKWIYFNTEIFDGHAQIARVRVDGSGIEQLTFDEFVNWFPHISPDGKWANYISFPPGTRGHPSNVWVDVKAVALEDWRSTATVAHLFGGQGTLNTNSWSPDSSAFAFVSYPTDAGE